MNDAFARRLRIFALAIVSIGLSQPVAAKPGGGNGKPGGGGDEPTGCATVGTNNYFPTIVYRESVGRNRNAHWTIGFGSANGSCRMTVKEFPPGQDGALYPAFWVNPDGPDPDRTEGLLAWRDGGEQYTVATVYIRVAPFTIDRSSDVPVVTLGDAAAVVTIEPSEYRQDGTWGHDISPNGACLVYDANTPTHDELRFVDLVEGEVDGCQGASTIALDPADDGYRFADSLSFPRWAPDASSVYARIVQYEFPDDGAGAWGLVRANLADGSLDLTVQPSRTEEVLEFDVGLYKGETHVIFSQEDGTWDDGNTDACPLLHLVNGDGVPVAGAVPFRGRYPLWTRFGTLSDVNPSIVYFAGAGDEFCSGLGAMETDPVNLGPVAIDYPENDFRWYDAN